MKPMQMTMVARKSINKIYGRYPKVPDGMREYPSIPGAFIQSRRPKWYAVVRDGTR